MSPLVVGWGGLKSHTLCTISGERVWLLIERKRIFFFPFIMGILKAHPSVEEFNGLDNARHRAPFIIPVGLISFQLRAPAPTHPSAPRVCLSLRYHLCLYRT